MEQNEGPRNKFMLEIGAGLEEVKMPQSFPTIFKLSIKKNLNKYFNLIFQ